MELIYKRDVMENETIERIIDSFKETLEELKRGNHNIYTKMDRVMEKVSGHDTDIQLLKVQSIHSNEHITALFSKQEEAITWQANFIDKMGSGNKQNLIIALMVFTLLVAIAGIFIGVKI